ncbi:MAG: hypothetical protein AAF596_08435 [Planctomycetota bacterium]
MSASSVTFDTLTVGLGDDAAIGETLAVERPPVLARTPRVEGNELPSGAKAAGATPRAAGDWTPFQVTTEAAADAPARTAAAPKKVAPPKRHVAHDAHSKEAHAGVSTVSATRSKPTEEPAPGWSTTLLKLNAGGRPMGKLLVAILLAAIAGVSVLLLRSARDAVGPAPIESPTWTPAPLAGTAPLFVPEPLATAERAFGDGGRGRDQPQPYAPSLGGSNAFASKPSIDAVGPAGLAAPRVDPSPTQPFAADRTPGVPSVEGPRVAALPGPASPPSSTLPLSTPPSSVSPSQASPSSAPRSPYPSTGYRSAATALAPATPSARLTGGIRPTAAAPALPNPSRGTNEQDRPSLY